jgi:hypothetical protein
VPPLPNAVRTPSPEPGLKPLAQVLAQPAQMAARQDSMAPLLQNLSALQGRMAAFPPAVAEAALKLLANRLSLDRGAPTADAIRNAVTRAGVITEAGRPAPQGDVKAALLQLRAGLLTMLDGGAVAAVAPVLRRPPPPLRDSQPRGIRSDAPTLPDSTNAREAGRTLLNQAEGALSRLKLTQMASSPPDAARASALPSADFMVELPMMLGHELSIAQLQIQRDGSNKSKKAERGWRVRFAVSFSAIGEVGAQVALLGGTTNVVIWAGEPATADALEKMLPELAPALGARGLTVGTVRLRRGAPPSDAPAAGRLMDEVR